MRRRAEGLLITQTLYDIGLGPHRARDDAGLATLGTDSALTRYNKILPEVGLLTHVIVVGKDGGLELNMREEATEHVLVQLHHDHAIEHGVFLGPHKVMAISCHLRGAGEEDS